MKELLSTAPDAVLRESVCLPRHPGGILVGMPSSTASGCLESVGLRLPTCHMSGVPKMTFTAVKVPITGSQVVVIDSAGERPHLGPSLPPPWPCPSPTMQPVLGWSPKCTWCTVRGRGRRSPREALDSQALASLFPPPGCPAFGVDALFDSVPVRFRDSKFIKEVTWKNTSQIKVPWAEDHPWDPSVWEQPEHKNVIGAESLPYRHAG